MGVGVAVGAAATTVVVADAVVVPATVIVTEQVALLKALLASVNTAFA
jgi:hypothetical protein